MPTEVSVALIAFLGTLVGTFGGIRLIAYRLEQLEKKVEKHNNLVERVYKCEKINELLEEKIKVANHRIEDLECTKT